MVVEALIFAGVYAAYYLLKVVKKPVLVCSNEKLRHILALNCPSLNQKFWPTFWAFESRLQTILRVALQNDPKHDFSRQLVHLPDGGIVAFDWKNSENANPSTPIVVICPGLSGDSKEPYVGNFINEANDLGFRTAVFIYRGNGGLPLKTPRLYCAGSYEDLAFALEDLKQKNPQSPIYGCGFSLGAILWYRYMASLSTKSLIRACVTISMPWDTYRTNQTLEKPLNQILFSRQMAQNLLKKFRGHFHVFEKETDKYDFDAVFKSQSVRDIDQHFTCPMFGFKNVDEFYDFISPCNHFKSLPCPVVSIQAADDVFVFYCLVENLVVLSIMFSFVRFALEETIPLDEISRLPGSLAVIMTSHGGHIGFVEGLFPSGRTWADHAAGQALVALHSYTYLSEN